MSTYNICFYEELTKIILQLSSKTHLVCSTVYPDQMAPSGAVSSGAILRGQTCCQTPKCENFYKCTKAPEIF